MTQIDILLTFEELCTIEDYICKQLPKIKDKKIYNSIASLTTIINDLIHFKETEN